MLHRIRLAMQTGSFDKLDGEVEVDETFIGGKARNMHKDARRKITGTGATGQDRRRRALQRGGEVRARVIPDTKRHTLQARSRASTSSTGARSTRTRTGSYTGLARDVRPRRPSTTPSST